MAATIASHRVAVSRFLTSIRHPQGELPGARDAQGEAPLAEAARLGRSTEVVPLIEPAAPVNLQSCLGLQSGLDRRSVADFKVLVYNAAYRKLAGPLSRGPAGKGSGSQPA